MKVLIKNYFLDIFQFYWIDSLKIRGGRRSDDDIENQTNLSEDIPVKILFTGSYQYKQSISYLAEIMDES